jgi:arylsulfatase A-like enzyme
MSDAPPVAPGRRDFLKTAGALGLGTALSAIPVRASAQTAPPNIIVVLIDDLGSNQFGCYGNTFNETPNIDALAAQGTRFKTAYAPSPVCSPSRASLLTGNYPARTGITDFLGPSLPDTCLDPSSNTTLAKLFHQTGHTCGLIGKWHLTDHFGGPGSPQEHGFDEVIASENQHIGSGDYFHPYAFMPDLPALQEGEYLTDRLNTEAVRFISANASRPFFLYLALPAVHEALAAKADKIAKYEQKEGADTHDPVLAAMLESVDEGIGMIRAALKQHGIADNTVIVVASDNGGDPHASSIAPLRGYKSQLYEGGIRVPLIVHWPGAPAGNAPQAVVSLMDLAPTLLGIAGAGIPAGLDGKDLRPLIQGTGVLSSTNLFWLYPHYHSLGGVPSAVVRRGSHKLIQDLRTRQVEVYDLSVDPGEKTNLAGSVAYEDDLRSALETHVSAMKVIPPSPSPEEYPVIDVEDEFEKGSTRPALGSGTSATVSSGSLQVAGNGLLTLFDTGVSPAALPAAVVVRIGSFANVAQGGEDTIHAGLVKDATRFVTVWHNNKLGQTGWTVRLGTTTTTARITQLDQKVSLTTPGARLGFVVRGNVITAFADSQASWTWDFLFNMDLTGLIELRDPTVRSTYRYGYGVRASEGTVSLMSVRGRRAGVPTAP